MTFRFIWISVAFLFCHGYLPIASDMPALKVKKNGNIQPIQNLQLRTSSKETEKRKWRLEIEAEGLAPDEMLALTGNVDQLGDWNVKNAKYLKRKKDAPNVWFCELELPQGFTVEYKYLIKKAPELEDVEERCIEDIATDCVIKETINHMAPRTVSLCGDGENETLPSPGFCQFNTVAFGLQDDEYLKIAISSAKIGKSNARQTFAMEKKNQNEQESLWFLESKLEEQNFTYYYMIEKKPKLETEERCFKTPEDGGKLLVKDLFGNSSHMVCEEVEFGNNSTQTAICTFELDAGALGLCEDDTVSITGSNDWLGNWQENRAVPLHRTKMNRWAATIPLPVGQEMAYKYLIHHSPRIEDEQIHRKGCIQRNSITAVKDVFNRTTLSWNRKPPTVQLHKPVDAKSSKERKIMFEVKSFADVQSPIGVVGSTDILGKWDTAKALELNVSKTDRNTWTGAFCLDGNDFLRYKYVHLKQPRWEGILENRKILTQSAEVNWVEGRRDNMMIDRHILDHLNCHYVHHEPVQDMDSSFLVPSHPEVPQKSLCCFNVEARGLHEKDVVCLSGEDEALGGWDPAKSTRLQKIKIGHTEVWSTCLELPAAQSISYKYFVARRGGEDAEEEMFWEPGDDRETRINEVGLRTGVFDKFEMPFFFREVAVEREKLMEEKARNASMVNDTTRSSGGSHSPVDKDREHVAEGEKVEQKGKPTNQEEKPKACNDASATVNNDLELHDESCGVASPVLDRGVDEVVHDIQESAVLHESGLRPLEDTQQENSERLGADGHITPTPMITKSETDTCGDDRQRQASKGDAAEIGKEATGSKEQSLLSGCEEKESGSQSMVKAEREKAEEERRASREEQAVPVQVAIEADKPLEEAAEGDAPAPVAMESQAQAQECVAGSAEAGADEREEVTMEGQAEAAQIAAQAEARPEEAARVEREVEAEAQEQEQAQVRAIAEEEASAHATDTEGMEKQENEDVHTDMEEGEMLEEDQQSHQEILQVAAHESFAESAKVPQEGTQAKEKSLAEAMDEDAGGKSEDSLLVEQTRARRSDSLADSRLELGVEDSFAPADRSLANLPVNLLVDNLCKRSVGELRSQAHRLYRLGVHARSSGHSQEDDVESTKEDREKIHSETNSSLKPHKMDSLNFLEFHVASEITPGPTPKGRTHSQIAQENDQLQKDMIRNGYNNLPLDDTVSMESVNEVCLHPASENDKEEKQEQADRSLRQSSIATAQNNLQTINKILERLRLEDEDIQPFAVVEEVMPSSPAEEGGMMVGDRIIAIGSADASSVKRFGVSLVGDAVERMEGQELTLLISRVNRVTGRELRELPLKIVPRRWGGEGLLGARFVRLTP